MSWADIGKQVANIAPIVGAALGGPAGGAVGTLIASAFGVENTPQAVRNALATDPETLLKLQALQLEHRTELQRMVLTAETARLAEVNATMRAEYAQDDKYVKRWRPTFGYAVSLTWVVESFAVMAALVYIVTNSPQDATVVINAIAAMIGAMAVQWGIALSVLGIAVTERSKDKQIEAGVAPTTGIFSAVAQRIAGRNQ